MAETRDRTSAPAQRMSDPGMPSGQAPTVHRQMTAVERRNAEVARKVQEARSAILTEIEARRSDMEVYLRAFDIPYDMFTAGLLLFLSRQEREQPEFFDNLHMPSFLDALTRVAMNGLLPDGKEAAIAAYASKDHGGMKIAQVMFMRDGFVKVLWRTGLIRSINDQVVTEAEYKAGGFEYEEGDQGYIRHKLDIRRKDTDPVVAAYCIIELITGGVMREVVPEDELKKMAAMSRSPARKSWQHQMHRKGAIRRLASSKMPKHPALVQLLDHDALSYSSSLDQGAQEADRPSTTDLFSNKPIRKRRGRRAAQAQEAPALEAPQTQDAVDVDVEPQEQPQDAVETTQEPIEQPFALRALLTAKNGVQLFPEDQAELWFGDIQQKMKTLPSEHLPKFWAINRPFIEEAGRNGHVDFAMRLMALAREMSLEGSGDE